MPPPSWKSFLAGWSWLHTRGAFDFCHALLQQLTGLPPRRNVLEQARVPGHDVGELVEGKLRARHLAQRGGKVDVGECEVAGGDEVVGEIRRVVCGSPAYFAAHGTPKTSALTTPSVATLRSCCQYWNGFVPGLALQ